MRQFYVYDLVDPRDGVTFYVGKGTGDRKSQHVREALRGKRSRKCARIREIIDAGLSVGEVVVATFWDEQDAYDAEASRIAKIGLDRLTNVLPGGRGGTAYLDYQLRRAGSWTAAAISGMARILRLPPDTKLFLGPYDVSFAHQTARMQLRKLVHDIGFTRAASALQKYGVNLVRGVA